MSDEVFESKIETLDKTETDKIATMTESNFPSTAEENIVEHFESENPNEEPKKNQQDLENLEDEHELNKSPIEEKPEEIIRTGTQPEQLEHDQEPDTNDGRRGKT